MYYLICIIVRRGRETASQGYNQWATNKNELKLMTTKAFLLVETAGDSYISRHGDPPQCCHYRREGKEVT
jgi:hypothetical protein